MKIRKRLVLPLAIGALLTGGSIAGVVGIASAQNQPGAGGQNQSAVHQSASAPQNESGGEVEKSDAAETGNEAAGATNDAAETGNEAADATLPGDGHQDQPGVNVDHQAQGVE